MPMPDRIETEIWDEKPDHRSSAESDTNSPPGLQDGKPQSKPDLHPQTHSPSPPAPAITPTVPNPDEYPDKLASPVPDGGLEAWLQVLGSWVVLVATWGLVNSYGVFQTYYEQGTLFRASASSISWIGSLQASLLLIVGPIAGPAYDSGYFRGVLWMGLFLIIFGQFMTSLCNTYWQVLLAQGLCIGIGCGLIFLPSTAILSQYFLKKRALVIGISSTGSPIAGMIFPVIFGRLEPKIGFRWTTRVIAFILLGLSTIPVAFMHLRTAPPDRRRSLIDASALRDVPFLLYAVGSFFAFLTLYVAFFYIQLYAIQFDLCDLDFSPYLVTLLSAGSIVGRLLPNYLADHIGSMNVMALVAILSSVLCFVWLGVDNLGGLIAFAVLYGLSSGGVVSVSPTAVVSLSPDLGVVGTRMGMVFFSTGFAILIGTPIAGAIVKGYGEEQWVRTIGYTAAGLMVGAGAFLGCRVVQFRKRRELKG